MNSYIFPKSIGSFLPTYAYQALIKEFIPCGFVIDDSLSILHIFGTAGEFIFHEEGLVKLNILSMISNQLKVPLSEALQQSKQTKEILTYTGINANNNKGENKHVNLSIKPVIDNHHITYYCIRIELNDTAPQEEIIEQYNAHDSALALIASLELKLQHTAEILQNTIVELENTNEELLTSNEELKSVNQVLYTANIEHQKKILELKDSYTSIDNLLRSTSIGVILVDASLKVRMFTPVISQFFDLVENDINRSLKSFIFHANFPDLLEKIEWVIEHKRLFETEIIDTQGQWNLLRILPYLTNENVIDGAIVTLININEFKTLQANLKLSDNRLYLAMKSTRVAFYRWDFIKNVVEHDNNVAALFGIRDSKSIRGYEQFEELILPEDRESIKRALNLSLTTMDRDFSVEFRVLWPDQSIHHIASRSQVYQDKEGNNRYLIGVSWDITAHINSEA